MYICTYIHIHIYINTDVYTYIDTSIHKYTDTYLHIYTHACACICVYVYPGKYLYMYICINVNKYRGIHVCMYIATTTACKGANDPASFLFAQIQIPDSDHSRVGCGEDLRKTSCQLGYFQAWI